MDKLEDRFDGRREHLFLAGTHAVGKVVCLQFPRR
jgi:hypothetical protein